MGHLGGGAAAQEVLFIVRLPQMSEQGMQMGLLRLQMLYMSVLLMFFTFFIVNFTIFHFIPLLLLFLRYLSLLLP